MRVVQRMGLVKTNSDDRPDEDIKIMTARPLQSEEGN